MVKMIYATSLRVGWEPIVKIMNMVKIVKIVKFVYAAGWRVGWVPW